MVDKYDDVIDSRDIIARIEELQDEGDADGALSPDDFEELTELRALAAECADYASDWEYGETLIRESYWEDYVRELLEDCGDIPKDLPNYIVIDWEATARNIAADYTTVEFGGIDYYIRCS